MSRSNQEQFIIWMKESENFAEATPVESVCNFAGVNVLACENRLLALVEMTHGTKAKLEKRFPEVHISANSVSELI